jgi:O-antigen ligase
MGTSVEASGADGAELEAGARLRVDTWRAILELVNDHPFEGVGYGGLQYVLPQTGENLGVDVKDSSHNTFLRMLGEMGIFGLVLFLWLLVACWKVGWKTVKAARTKFDRQIGVAVGAGTLALVTSCAFGDRFFNPLVSGGFWIAIALAEDAVRPLPPAEVRT